MPAADTCRSSDGGTARRGGEATAAASGSGRLLVPQMLGLSRLLALRTKTDRDLRY